MYVGNVVGFLGLTLVGDVLGRKMLMLANLIICAVGMIITVFAVNLTMAGIGLFISTCGIQNAFNICFYYIAETVSESHREKFSVAIQLFYGLGVLINVLWFYAVGNWQIILAVFYLVPLVMVIIGVYFFVRDTPICLVTRYTPSVAVKEFNFIAKMNKKDEF
jgi:MFS family permease